MPPEEDWLSRHLLEESRRIQGDVGSLTLELRNVDHQLRNIQSQLDGLGPALTAIEEQLREQRTRLDTGEASAAEAVSQLESVYQHVAELRAELTKVCGTLEGRVSEPDDDAEGEAVDPVGLLTHAASVANRVLDVFEAFVTGWGAWARDSKIGAGVTAAIWLTLLALLVGLFRLYGVEARLEDLPLDSLLPGTVQEADEGDGSGDAIVEPPDAPYWGGRRGEDHE